MDIRTMDKRILKHIRNTVSSWAFLLNRTLDLLNIQFGTIDATMGLHIGTPVNKPYCRSDQLLHYRRAMSNTIFP